MNQESHTPSVEFGNFCTKTLAFLHNNHSEFNNIKLANNAYCVKETIVPSKFQSPTKFSDFPIIFVISTQFFNRFYIFSKLAFLHD